MCAAYSPCIGGRAAVSVVVGNAAGAMCAECAAGSRQQALNVDMLIKEERGMY